jgi:hypothetical protein
VLVLLAIVASAGCESPLGGLRRDAEPPPLDAAAEPDGYPPPDAPLAPPPDAYVPPDPPDAGPRFAPNECPAEPQPTEFSDIWIPTEPGPIVRYTVRPYHTVYPTGVPHDPVTTGDVLAGGVWIVPLGHVLIADSFQKNAANRLCQWIEYPEWTIDDPTCAIHRRPIGNPFLFKATTEHVGEFTLQATIDGVVSNVLRVRVVP